MEDTPPRPIYIKLMGDYYSTGIWHANGVMAEPEDLPVSPALHKQLVAWAASYDLNEDYLAEGIESKLGFDLPANGYRIASAMRESRASQTFTEYFKLLPLGL
ncbi:hypothetical protein AWB67_07222 [Caballeronia terrestris]|jgi:hypothetical protein|uniref:Uncharacterized protein n=1 Tax=Caballeronia terrestris TaxID=1226301 RepID=A0A158KZG6_9BURK|nr:hypothetical protein [Caballeronia terrestris]SAL86546.1 hypothetical protein AWB67_07222 [Caballeronia terrestris]